MSTDVGRCAFIDDSASLQKDRTVAESRHNPWIVADEDDRMACVPQFPITTLTFSSEASITDREDLIEHQDVAYCLKRD